MWNDIISYMSEFGSSRPDEERKARPDEEGKSKNEAPEFVGSWLIESDEELRDLEDAGPFGRRIKALHNGINAGIGLGADDLRKEFLSLDEKAAEAGLPLKGVYGSFLPRIAGEIQRLDREAASDFGDLPRDPEKQREYVRRILDQVEQNDQPTWEYQNAEKTTHLEKILNRLSKELRLEVQARLRLQDCYVKVREAVTRGGDVVLPDGKKQPGMLFRQVSAELAGKGRLLQGQDFETLFKEMTGLKVAQAFLLLEEAALVGRDGAKIFEEGTTNQQEEKVREDIARELGGDLNARKAVQLAERLAWATFETSVWNNDLKGLDPLAQAIYLRGYRLGLSPASTDIGPPVTLRLIEGIGTSYFRQAMLANGDFLYDPPELRTLPDDYETSETVVIRESKRVGERSTLISSAWRKLLQRTRGSLRDGADEDSMLVDPSVLNFMGLGPDDYGAYLALRLPQIMTVRRALLETDWEPRELQSDKIDPLMAPFKYVDPGMVMDLRFYFVLGALSSTFRSRARLQDLGWTQTELRVVKDALTRIQEWDESGRPVRFINTHELDRILNKIKAYPKLRTAVFWGDGTKPRR